jgi:hypothetical protein
METIHRIVNGVKIALSDTEVKALQSENQGLNADFIIKKAEYDALAWKRNRLADYPNIQDCIHAILDDDLEALQVKRQEVKNRYPKP